MMKYELPTLPPYFYGREAGENEKCLSIDQVERYAEQAVAPLLAEIERLKILAKEEYESGYDAGQESMRQRLS